MSCEKRSPLLLPVAKPLNALVTGAAGFVGRHLVHHLTEQGDQVFGADRPGSPVVTECAGWHSVELLDRPAVNDVITSARPDVVYHLAGQASVWMSREDPAGTFSVNVLPLLHIITACQRAGLDPVIVVIGSNDVYGDAPVPTSEDVPMRPQSPYAASKAAQDLVALQYFLSDNVRTIRLRPFTHIGPGQRPDFALASFARQIAAVEAGVQEPVLKVGNLDAERDLTDARDMVRAYRLAGTRGKAGEVYNLGSGAPVRLRDALDTLVNHSNRSIEVSVDSSRLRAADIPVTMCDGRRFHEATGYVPEIPIDQTLVDILNYWRSRPVTELVDSPRGS